MSKTTNPPVDLTVDEADVLRKLAEARKFDAEASLAEWDASLREAEVRQTVAEALEAEQSALIKTISRKERERVEDLSMVQDHYAFHHFFDGPVMEKTVYGALNTMNAWHRMHPTSDWDITINSPGGSVIDGMHLFDAITTYSRRGGGKHNITMTVRGYAASMAGILLQAADVRRVGPESYIMIHEVSSFAQGKIGELKDEIKFLERISERVANIFVTRSKEAAEANPDVIEGISMETFEKGWNRTDWWLDSAQALKHGIVDEIG